MGSSTREKVGPLSLCPLSVVQRCFLEISKPSPNGIMSLQGDAHLSGVC